MKINQEMILTKGKLQWKVIIIEPKPCSSLVCIKYLETNCHDWVDVSQLKEI